MGRIEQQDVGGIKSASRNERAGIRRQGESNGRRRDGLNLPGSIVAGWIDAGDRYRVVRSQGMAVGFYCRRSRRPSCPTDLVRVLITWICGRILVTELRRNGVGK